MTLREAKYKHIQKILKECKGNRTMTAKILDVSIRGLRNYLCEMKSAGMDVMDRKEKKIRSVFATNQERLEHADKMINADFLN